MCDEAVPDPRYPAHLNIATRSLCAPIGRVDPSWFGFGKEVPVVMASCTAVKMDETF